MFHCLETFKGSEERRKGLPKVGPSNRECGCCQNANVVRFAQAASLFSSVSPGGSRKKLIRTSLFRGFGHLADHGLETRDKTHRSKQPLAKHSSAHSFPMGMDATTRLRLTAHITMHACRQRELRCSLLVL